jgi:hypothetical protein
MHFENGKTNFIYNCRIFWIQILLDLTCFKHHIYMYSCTFIEMGFNLDVVGSFTFCCLFLNMFNNTFSCLDEMCDSV